MLQILNNPKNKCPLFKVVKMILNARDQLFTFTKSCKLNLFVVKVVKISTWRHLAVHSRKYGPVLASCKVAFISDYFNRHRFKCSMDHATFHEASSLLFFSTEQFEYQIKGTDTDSTKIKRPGHNIRIY